MNQHSAINDADTMCSSCCQRELCFLHSVWIKDSVHRLCTSCVLRTHKESFCPICFTVYDDPHPGDTIRCCRCRSYSHETCISYHISARQPFLCSTCIHYNSLLFILRKVKSDKGNYVAINKSDAKMLLAASKIAAISMRNGVKIANELAEDRINDAVITKKKATNVLNWFMDRAPKREADDQSCKVLRQSGGLQMVAAEGAGYKAGSRRVAFEIDLNADPPINMENGDGSQE